MKWGVFFVKKVENGEGFFVKKWTFPQCRVYYVQYQYFLFYILLIGVAYCIHTECTLPTGLQLLLVIISGIVLYQQY